MKISPQEQHKNGQTHHIQIKHSCDRSFITHCGALIYKVQQINDKYQSEIGELQKQLAQSQQAINAELANTQQQTLDQAKQINLKTETSLEQQKSIKSLQVEISDVKGHALTTGCLPS